MLYKMVTTAELSNIKKLIGGVCIGGALIGVVGGFRAGAISNRQELIREALTGVVAACFGIVVSSSIVSLAKNITEPNPIYIMQHSNILCCEDSDDDKPYVPNTKLNNEVD